MDGLQRLPYIFHGIYNILLYVSVNKVILIGRLYSLPLNNRGSRETDMSHRYLNVYIIKIQ
jgi:hypothetical protein